MEPVSLADSTNPDDIIARNAYDECFAGFIAADISTIGTVHDPRINAPDEVQVCEGEYWATCNHIYSLVDIRSHRCY